MADQILQYIPGEEERRRLQEQMAGPGAALLPPAAPPVTQEAPNEEYIAPTVAAAAALDAPPPAAAEEQDTISLYEQLRNDMNARKAYRRAQFEDLIQQSRKQSTLLGLANAMQNIGRRARGAPTVQRENNQAAQEFQMRRAMLADDQRDEMATMREFQMKNQLDQMDPNSEVSKKVQGFLKSRGFPEDFTKNITPASPLYGQALQQIQRSEEMEAQRMKRLQDMEDFAAREGIKLDGKKEMADYTREDEDRRAALVGGNSAAIRSLGGVNMPSRQQAMGSVLKDFVGMEIKSREAELGRSLKSEEIEELTQQSLAEARTMGVRNLRKRVRDQKALLDKANAPLSRKDKLARREGYFSELEKRGYNMTRNAHRRLRGPLSKLDKGEKAMVASALQIPEGGVFTAAAAGVANPNALAVLSAIQEVINKELKRDSGAAVSKNEMARFLLSTGITPTRPETLNNFATKVKNNMETIKADVEKQYPDVRKELRQEEKKANMFKFTVTSADGSKSKTKTAGRELFETIKKKAEAVGMTVEVLNAYEVK